MSGIASQLEGSAWALSWWSARQAFDRRQRFVAVRTLRQRQGLHRGRGRSLPIQQGFDALPLRFGGRGQPAVRADPLETARQYVLEKAPQKLRRSQGQRLPTAVVAAPEPERDAAFVVGEDARAGERRLVDVSGEILQRGSASADGQRIHDPVGPPDDGGNLAGEFRGQRQCAAQPIAESAGEHFLWEKELVGGDPVPAQSVRTESGPGDDVVNVRVIDQRPAPGVQHAEHSQLRAEVLGVRGHFLQRGGAFVKQPGEQFPLVGADDGAQLGRDGEGDQKIWHTG